MGKSITIAEALFSKTQRLVLGLLYGRPERSFYLKEIIDRINVGHGAVQRELAKLLSAELITLRAIGNQRHYQANKDCLIFSELASILRKTSGLVDVMADALASLGSKIEVAFVFGSMASGKATAGSDIDLMVIGDVSFSDVGSATYSAQEVLGREINPKVYSKEEWVKMCKKKNVFIKEVIAKPKLFVVGSNNELG